MAVIINEFEVVTEPAPAAPANGGGSNSAATTGPTPEEVEAMLVKIAERILRLRAY